MEARSWSRDGRVSTPASVTSWVQQCAGAQAAGCRSEVTGGSQSQDKVWVGKEHTGRDGAWPGPSSRYALGEWYETVLNYDEDIMDEGEIREEGKAEGRWWGGWEREEGLGGSTRQSVPQLLQVASAAGRPVALQQRQVEKRKAPERTPALEPGKLEVRHKGHMALVAVEANEHINSGEACLYNGIYIMDTGVGTDAAPMHGTEMKGDSDSVQASETASGPREHETEGVKGE
ncbi:hypothetical protein NDU88_006795 [Pleurodeles waltl]|uniref:Uncharacterized protein n=1 Tax=Pleurodeles waltl TaxID=8319 RepID=A0AAV7SQX5_PLEWA|nr:hypothetical protein NDU88_006795 [Pleurodeles waltl]